MIQPGRESGRLQGGRLLRHRCPATQRRESGRRTDTVRRKRRPAGDVSISGEKGPRWVTRPLRHRHSLAADSGPERVPRRPGAARDGQDRLPGLHGRHDSQQGCASARLDSASLWHILVTADAHHMKRPARQTPWQPAEYRIVRRFARRLVAGRYRSLGAAADECFLELRDRSAARPGAPKHDRVYPRTYDAVRSRLTLKGRGHTRVPAIVQDVDSGRTPPGLQVGTEVLAASATETHASTPRCSARVAG